MEPSRPGSAGSDGHAEEEAPNKTMLPSNARPTTTTAAVATPIAKQIMEEEADKGETKGDILEFIPTNSKIEPSLLEPLNLDSLDPQDLSLFAEEYAKLQQALRMSHESENRVVNKCQAQMKAIRSSQHKLTALASLFQTDQKKLEKLKEDILSHKTAYSTTSAEITMIQEDNKNLKEEVKTIETNIQENSSNDAIRQQKEHLANLEADVAKATVARDKDRAELTRIRVKNTDLAKQLQDVLAGQKKGQEELDLLDRKIREINAISSKEIRRQAELERQTKNLTFTVEERKRSIEKSADLLTKCQSDLLSVQSSRVRNIEAVERQREEFDALSEKAKANNTLLLLVQEQNAVAIEQLTMAEKELEEQADASQKAKLHSSNKRKTVDVIRLKVKQMEEESRLVEAEKFELEAKMEEFKTETRQINMKIIANQKHIDSSIREREEFSHKHAQTLDLTKRHELALRIQRSISTNARNEMVASQNSIRQQHKIIENLKAEKAIHEVELHKRTLQRARAWEDVLDRGVKIAQFQQQIVLNDSKLRQQQNLLDAVRTDRNMYRKTLIEQKNEMQELKRKHSNLNQLIKQLKQEIAEKDMAYMNEHFNLEAVNNDIVVLEEHTNTTSNRIKEIDQIIESQAVAVRKLTTIIADADEEIRVQTKQYNAIVNEQRVLSQQLIQRNAELAKLYEQLKLQNSVLGKGSTHYNEVLETIQMYEKSKNQQISTLDELMADTGKFEELRTTIAHIENELQQERLRTMSLTEDLKKPINIHRWRRLMDTNTDTYAMLNRVRGLQKQIISKNAQVEEADQQIQEKEKLYIDLRRVIARQPGSESAEQLRLFAATLREKKSKFKQLKSELKMYQSKVYEYKYELQKLDQDLQLVKLEYFTRRRQMQRQQTASTVGDFFDDDNEEEQYTGEYQGYSDAVTMPPINSVAALGDVLKGENYAASSTPASRPQTDSCLMSEREERKSTSARSNLSSDSTRMTHQFLQ